MRLFLFFFTFALLTLSHASYAQDTQSVLSLPEGQTVLNLSATERTTVQQDLLTATLRYEVKGKDAKALQDEINKTMEKALDTAREYDDVKVSTQQYYVYPYDPRPKDGNGNRRREWRGSQSLELKGKDAEALLELTGKLQSMGLTMGGLGYSVSPELMEETRDSLLEDALEKLNAKAERTAKALGKSKSELRSINIDTGGYNPQPMMRAMAMDSAESASVSTPVAAPGESDITLTVSATALLKP